MQLIIQWQKLINTDKLSLWFITTTAKVYEHREIKFVIIHLIRQRQKLINTDKLSLWLYNGDYAIDCKTAKGYQHWQTEFVIIQRQKSTNTDPIKYVTIQLNIQREKVISTDKLRLWLYNVKSLLTQKTEFVITKRQKFINTDKLHAIVIVYENRETAFVIIYNGKSLPTLTNWVCDYTTSKVREHRETEFVIIQRQKFANTNKLSLWLYNVKSPRTQRNWVCDYTTAKVYQHWPTL